jgi:hypothetical protein
MNAVRKRALLLEALENRQPLTTTFGIMPQSVTEPTSPGTTQLNAVLIKR